MSGEFNQIINFSCVVLSRRSLFDFYAKILMR